MDAPNSTHINGYRSGRAHHKALHIQCMTMMIMIIIMMAYCGSMAMSYIYH
jgi:hypothetical protein